MLITNYTEKPFKLSVITATYNAAEDLPRLIDSLRRQTDKDFEWVVADGASGDGTLELLQSVNDLNVKISSQEDFGIYDALNRAIKACNGEFYLVVGADDLLYPEALQRYKEAITNLNADLITAGVMMDGIVIRHSSRPWIWLCGAAAKISSHSVGVCIRTVLHGKLGWYSSKFPIYADSYFLLKVIKSKYTIKTIDFVAGEFSTAGCSNRNRIFTIAEQFQVQVLTGSNIILQLFLFNLQILKQVKKLHRTQ